MSKKNKIPEVRFKTFIDDWEDKKIGKILTEKNRSIHLEDDKEYQLVTVKRRNKGIVSRGYLKGKDILVKNYFQVKTGDYIISKRQVVHGANGLIPKYLNNAVVSNEYLIAASNKNITTEYWSLISKLPKIHKLFFLSSYGVDIEKLIFDVEDWKKRNITIPQINEQNKIVGFFNNLDKLISQHQRKEEKLVILKKSMLVKMFPKNRKVVPEIRFKEFTKDWEENNLSDITDYHNGKGHEDQQVKSGKYELINLNSISIDGGLKPSGKFINEANATLNKGDLVIILSDVAHGNLLGRVAVIPENNRYVLNQRVALLRPNINVNSIFLLHNINSNQSYFKMQGAGMSQLNLSRSSVEDFTLFIPCNDEQNKIGLYFKNLDNQIELHQMQLKKLKNIKKACFSKMSVAQE